MMKKTFLAVSVCLFQLIALSAHAQSLTFQGVVIDAETRETIPFAHLKILNVPGKGFVTDANGTFDYRLDQSKIQVEISSIGYESRVVEITAGVATTIALKPSTFSLQGVVVSGIDQERALLKKVLKNIPRNYPTSLERIRGKVIEKFATDSLYQNLLYSATSDIEADKLNYTRKHKYGNVKIIDGEVDMKPARDSTALRIMAGVHNVHRFDIVAARMEPFDQIDNRKYSFEFTDTLAFEGKPVIKLRFECKKYEGYLYVQDSSFALVKGEYTLKDEELKSSASGVDRLYLNFTTEYFRSDSLFRLSYINYRSAFQDNENPDKKLYLNNFFYLDEHQTSRQTIKYNEVTEFTDILVDELTDTPDAQELQDSIIRKYNRSRKLLKVISKFTTSLNIGAARYDPLVQSVNIDQVGVNQPLGGDIDKLVFLSSIGYQLSNSLSIQYTGGRTFRRGEMTIRNLHLNWHRPLSRDRRWLINLSGGLSHFKTDLNRGSTVGTGGVLEDTTFEAGALSIEEQSSILNIITGLQVEYQIGPRHFLTLSGYFPLSWRSRVDITLHQEDRQALAFQTTDNTLRSSYQLIALGLVFRL